MANRLEIVGQSECLGDIIAISSEERASDTCGSFDTEIYIAIGQHDSSFFGVRGRAEVIVAYLDLGIDDSGCCPAV